MKKPNLIIFGIDGACPDYIIKAVTEGKLPGFKRLLERGIFFEDCMPVFPSITPTCWSAISCGAVPSVTGALCHQVHVDGTHPTSYITPYNSKNIKAERFWETAAKKGLRSLIIDVPCSGPKKHDNVLQVMGSTYTPDRCPSESYKSGIPQQVFSNKIDERFTLDVRKNQAGASFEAIEGNGFSKNGGAIYTFAPSYSDKRYDPKEVEHHEWTVVVEEDGVRFGVNLANAREQRVLGIGEWTEVIERRLMTSDGFAVPFTFRARLDSFDKESGEFSVFLTGAKNFYKEISPSSLAKEISEIKETFAIDYSAIQPRECDLDKFFESERFSYDWTEAVVSHCIEKYEPEIIFEYQERIDALNHRFRSAFEGVCQKYDGEKEIAEEAMARGYKQADEHLSWLLDNAVGENTTIAVLSDHGSIGQSECFNPWQILEAEGLLSVRKPTDLINWKSDIDWAKTKAYPVGSCYINVNLKGREPCGSVDEEKYDEVVFEIIKALQKHGCKNEEGKSALAFATEGAQAGFIGHGGTNCGDVVYGLSGSHTGGYIGGVHSHQIPSARTKTGDIRALCIISGPKFKSGEHLSRPTDLTDIAPTLCYALGLDQPKDATGGVIFGAFGDKT